MTSNALNRRDILKAFAATAAASALPAATLAAPASSLQTTLVEVFNFRCPRSRAVNDWTAKIKAGAASAGIYYRPAPVAWTAAELWPDRFYYAARDLHPAAAPAIRDVLFGGIHDFGQTFEELAQILAYFESSKGDEKVVKADPGFNPLAVADRAGTEDALYPVIKAARLLEQTNAEEAPVFIWVTGGTVEKVISPADASEPPVLVRKVLAELTQK